MSTANAEAPSTTVLYFHPVIEFDDWFKGVWKRAIQRASSYLTQPEMDAIFAKAPVYETYRLCVPDEYPNCLFMRWSSDVVAAIPKNDDLERIEQWILRRAYGVQSHKNFRRTMNFARMEYVRDKLEEMVNSRKSRRDPNPPVLYSMDHEFSRPVDVLYHVSEKTTSDL